MRNWIKTKLVILILSCLVVGGYAQNRAIRFESGSFAEALKKAAQENKLLFMDCYTSWCGPCKLLAEKVFTQDTVADFFNSHFINFSIDMEKGEGESLQKRYDVKAYPTLLLIDPKGQVVFQSVGGCSGAELLSRFSEAMNPENTIPGMERKFASGERHPEFVGKYWKVLQKGRQTDQLRKSTEVYFEGMSISEICQEQNWALFNQFVDIDNSLYPLIIEHIQEVKELRGAKIIEEKLGRAYDYAIMGRIPNVGHTKEQIDRYAEEIEKVGFQDKEQLFYLQAYLKIARLKVEKKYDEYLDFMEKGLSEFSPEQRTRAMTSLIMLADATPEQRTRGNNILLREAKAVMERNQGTLPAYEQQMFGFIQYKLSGK